jgi:hypothetical protein
MKPKRATGWVFVDEQMQRQIERGQTTAEAYKQHFEEDGLMAGWLRYQKWIAERPGEEVPEEVNRIR